MSAHLLLVHALSPVHCGTGQAISGIDLPIARERPTGTPLIPGSTLKGVLRAHPGGSEESKKDMHLKVFGPETENAGDYAGAVQFADAHVVFLPIRSVRGTFAWVTSPHLLRRLARDLCECSLEWTMPSALPEDNEAFVTADRLIVKIDNKERVVFEDFDFNAKTSPELKKLAKAVGEALYGEGEKDDVQHFVDRACVVGDDVMRVLVRVGMEVMARNRINDETKTVEQGALWTEEALPTETILSGLVLATPVRRENPKELIEHVKGLCSRPLQLGGKASIGRGMCRVEVI